MNNTVDNLTDNLATGLMSGIRRVVGGQPQLSTLPANPNSPHPHRHQRVHHPSPNTATTALLLASPLHYNTPVANQERTGVDGVSLHPMAGSAGITCKRKSEELEQQQQAASDNKERSLSSRYGANAIS